MQGLILKDLINLKIYGRSFLIILVIFGFQAFWAANNTFAAGFITLFFAMMAVTSFSYDERAKWNLYALSMPVSRKTIVLSKYLMALILILIGGLMGLLIAYLPILTGRADNTAEVFWGVCASASAGLILLSVFLPLIYKFGSEKSRIFIMIIFFVPFILLMVFANRLSGLAMPSEATIITLVKLLPLAGLVLFGISYFISVAIFQNQDID